MASLLGPGAAQAELRKPAHVRHRYIDFHSVRLGLTSRFGPTAVVAKY